MQEFIYLMYLSMIVKNTSTVVIITENCCHHDILMVNNFNHKGCACLNLVFKMLMYFVQLQRWSSFFTLMLANLGEFRL